MGSIGKVMSPGQTPFGGVVGNGTKIAGMPVPGLNGIDPFGGGDEPVSAPQVDPRLKAIRDAQINQAESFRAALPGEKDRQGELASNDSRLGLAQKMDDLKRNASSRGLLYSGLRQGAESGAAAGAAGDLASQKTAINQKLENQANAFDSQAIQGGMNIANQQQSMNDFAYNQALAQKQARSQGLGGLFQGLGSIGGSAAAGKK